MPQVSFLWRTRIIAQFWIEIALYAYRQRHKKNHPPNADITYQTIKERHVVFPNIKIKAYNIYYAYVRAIFISVKKAFEHNFKFRFHVYTI